MLSFAARLQIVFVTLLLTLRVSFAATPLRGVAHEMDGQPIPNVEVSAIEGANPVRSQANGVFVLEFDKKEPGEPVRLVARKTGMVVVNSFDLQVILPKVSSASPLTLLLCREGDLQEMKRRYYSVEPEKRQRAMEAENERLRIELDQLKLTANKLAKEKEGQTLQEGSAHRSHEAMVLNRIGAIYRSQKQPEEAMKVFDEALRISRSLAKQEPATYRPDVAETLNNRGNLLVEQNRFEEARKDYDEALEISRVLGEQNSTYLPSVAMTLDNLGALFGKQGRTEEESAALDKALDLYRDLSKLNQSIYWPRVAETLIKIGTIKLANNPPEARKEFIEALALYRNIDRGEPGRYAQQIESARNLMRDTFNRTVTSYRELAQMNPAAYLPNVATTLRDLRTFLGKENRTQEARETFDEELDAYRKLAEFDRDTYLPAVAETLRDLATFLREHDQADDARKTLDDSLQIYRELAQRNRDKYLSSVAAIEYNLGTSFREQKRVDEARKAFDQALQTYRELARLGLDRPVVAARLYELGTFLREENRLEEARQTLAEALQTYQTLAKENASHRPKVARILTDLGMINRELSRKDEALKAFREALAVYRTIEPKPKQYSQEVEAIRGLLGERP